MLREALSSIRSVEDIGKLFSALGYTREDLPFTDGSVTVARWKGFKVVAAERRDARDGARQLARELANSSERALAAVVGTARELALAAPKLGQAGTTHVLFVSLDQPSAFALEQLERLAPGNKSTALAHALAVGDVLSCEKVGARFFIEFKIHLERIATSIDRRRSITDRRMVALLCLTRILFLYFVQAKGWLDGRSDYLKHHLDRSLARRRNFHRSILHPLFFGTLNQPPDRRSKKVHLGTIPYLNGGLFEPHPVERRIGATYFSNHIWRDVFDELFERFRFTVREDDEVGAIAPDMLGRVFERLMNPDDRHNSGTFYTPESVVRQVVTATIETALSKHLPKGVAQKLVAGETIAEVHAHTARSAVEGLRVLDPAVGSGAFLLGTLEVLSLMRLVLDPRPRPGVHVELRKEVLRHNLMGVDLNPVAVRLAELRLWLAVVADDPTTDIENVTPLPNLDGVVRQGDTLLDPLGAARSFNSVPSFSATDAGKAIREARLDLFDSRGRAHRSGAERLRRFELEIAHRLLESARENTKHAANDLTASAQSPDLFGKKIGLLGRQRERLQALARIRIELEKAQRRLADGVIPFFSFEVHAPDILYSGGFDAVVGNPPWVRAEHLPQRLRRALKERFYWWSANGQRGFHHLPDLSVAFLERCLELTKNGGAVGLLLPSKVTSAGYGEKARRGMVSETSIEYVHRVPDREAARFGATTYPLAIVVKKARAGKNHHVRLGFDAKDTVRQKSLDAPGPWILHPSRIRDALDEFRSAGKPLGEDSPPMLGVKTGADRLYVGRVVADRQGVSVVAFPDCEVPIESALLRPVLRGRDVRQFRTKPSYVIVWCHEENGAPFSSLPVNAANHFQKCAREARRRSDYRGGPVWMVFRTRCVFDGHRVVWTDIAQRPRAIVLEETKVPSAIPLNTCYVSAAIDRETALAAAAVFNSTWAAAFFASNADEARGGYHRINARVARLLPVPDPGSHRAVLAQLSKRVHEDEGNCNEDVDSAVALALGLSKRTQTTLRSLVHDTG